MYSLTKNEFLIMFLPSYRICKPFVQDKVAIDVIGPLYSPTYHFLFLKSFHSESKHKKKTQALIQKEELMAL